ncbi:LysE family transporter [Gammaproteobacteria bacterium]|nr:LysE family transporter [Gammaproteobacteria bacterium]
MQEVSLYLPGILLSLSAFGLAMMSPGPNILAVIGTSMAIGRKESLALAAGIALGTCIWVQLAVIGFAALMTSYAGVMIALKIAGGVYLLWLGYKSLRSAARSGNADASAVRLKGGRKAYFLRGLTVQMTNPKAALATVAIVSIGVHVNAPLWVGASVVVGATLLSAIGHALYAVAFSTDTMVRAYIRLRRWVEAALGAFFVAMGIRLLSDRG